MNRPLRDLLLSCALLMVLPCASAHEGKGMAGGFASGFLHPLLGWDPVVAMVAVGLLGLGT